MSPPPSDPLDPAAYGEAFADVYDAWYADVSDVEGTVATMVRLAAGGPVLELGIGTGRLALPLAAAGVAVHGIDASPAMVAQLRSKPGGERLDVLVGDFSRELPSVAGGFAAVFAAFNTFVNLTSLEGMRRCLALVASRLRPGGALVLENAVPAPDPVPSGIEVRTVAPDRVVLSAFTVADDVVTGSLVSFTTEGVQLRPWSVRLTTADDIATMAREVGFVEASRHAGWRNEPLDAQSGRCVTVFRLRSGTVNDQ